MIYQLTGFSGRSDVVGQLREFDFKDEVLSIKGLTLQDARNVLAVLATGQVGSPITYGGILKEIANPATPGEIKNSDVQAASPPVEQNVETKPAEPKDPPKAKTKTKQAEPDLIKPPAGMQVIDLGAAAKGDWVTSDLPPAGPALADEPANVMQLEAPVEAKPSASNMFDPNNIPAWAANAQTMRALAMAFHKEWGVPYNNTGVETMSQACLSVKDKVPFFAKPNLQSRLAAVVETLSDD